MRTLKMIAIVLSSAFLLNCGIESPESTTSTDEPQFRLPSCEALDGQGCSKKGPVGPCDNGTEEGGFCFCAQHNADPFKLVCS